MNDYADWGNTLIDIGINLLYFFYYVANHLVFSKIGESRTVEISENPDLGAGGFFFLFCISAPRPPPPQVVHSYTTSRS